MPADLDRLEWARRFAAAAKQSTPSIAPPTLYGLALQLIAMRMYDKYKDLPPEEAARREFPGNEGGGG